MEMVVEEFDSYKNKLRYPHLMNKPRIDSMLNYWWLLSRLCYQCCKIRSNHHIFVLQLKLHSCNDVYQKLALSPLPQYKIAVCTRVEWCMCKFWIVTWREIRYLMYEFTTEYPRFIIKLAKLFIIYDPYQFILIGKYIYYDSDCRPSNGNTHHILVTWHIRINYLKPIYENILSQIL